MGISVIGHEWCNRFVNFWLGWKPFFDQKVVARLRPFQTREFPGSGIISKIIFTANRTFLTNVVLIRPLIRERNTWKYWLIFAPLTPIVVRGWGENWKIELRWTKDFFHLWYRPIERIKYWKIQLPKFQPNLSFLNLMSQHITLALVLANTQSAITIIVQICHTSSFSPSVVPKGHTPYPPYTLRKFQDNLGCT